MTSLPPLAPYAEFNLGRSNDTLMRRAGSPDPAAAGTSILLQTISQRAPAGAGTLSVTAIGRDSFPSGEAKALRRGAGDR